MPLKTLSVSACLILLNFSRHFSPLFILSIVKWFGLRWRLPAQYELWTYSRLLPLRCEDNHCCLTCQCLFMILEKQRGKRQMPREQRKGKQIKRMGFKEKNGHMCIFNVFILERHSLLCYQNSYQNYIF